MILISVLAVASFSTEERRFLGAFKVGLSHAFESGTVDQYEYVMGSNDFLVAPAHSSPWLSLAIRYACAGRLAVELEGAYFFAASVMLVDPSDQNSVNIQTAEHFLAGRMSEPIPRQGEAPGVFCRGRGFRKYIRQGSG